MYKTRLIIVKIKFTNNFSFNMLSNVKEVSSIYCTKYKKIDLQYFPIVYRQDVYGRRNGIYTLVIKTKDAKQNVNYTSF